MPHIEIDDKVDDSVEVSDDEIVEESSGSYVLHHGEALAWLRSLPDGYADALVTDPPAGIGFMGKGWDRDKGGRTAWVAWLAEILREARRALKPGAAGFVWALPRTSHWTATACEDAGFEVRDVVTHVQGQGFPKSKALLKPAAENWILVRAPGPLRPLRIDDCRVPGSVSRPETQGYMRGWTGQTGNEDGHNPNVGRWPANFAMSHVSTACYTLKQDTPREVAHAIYAYYGVDEIMCALRNGVPWDALRPEAAKVLQQGVRWLEPEERAQEAVGANDMPGMRCELRGSAGLGQEWAAAVLHEKMPYEGEAAQIQNGPSAYPRSTTGNVGEGDGPLRDGTVEPVEGREVQDQGQVLERDDRDAPSGCAGVGSTNARREVQVHPGAQDCRGHDAKAPDIAVGSSASHQRGQGGQPSRESGGCSESGTLGASSRHRAETGQRDDRKREASRGEPVFTVASWAIPDGWVKFFRFSHSEGCGDVCEADCPVRLLGEQSGVNSSRAGKPRRSKKAGEGYGMTHTGSEYSDTGTAARFFPCFYQPKASKRDRGEGNNHPTVKSVALMRWLVRLVCPVGGLVLDPFTGSGSTGVAALAEGLRFAGCEREAEYVQIARARLDKALLLELGD